MAGMSFDAAHASNDTEMTLRPHTSNGSRERKLTKLMLQGVRATVLLSSHGNNAINDSLFT